MIFSAFGSDCIRADSVELTAATVSASKKIRRAKSFPSEKPRRFGAPNLFAKRKLFPTVTHSFMVRFAWFLVCRKRLYVCRYCALQVWYLVTLSFFFIGNWVKICTFCLHHEIGELRGYKGLVCPPDPLLHHSQSPDISCFCTDHVASCCSRTIMPMFC